jgi:cysteine desulfuration protein SufE
MTSLDGYPPLLEKILREFSQITDRYERAELLISYADQFRGVPDEIASRPYPEEHRVPYCESEAYVWAIPQPDRTLKLYFAVENPQGVSAMAMAAILDRTLSGLPPEQIATVSPDVVLKIFGQDVSMGKGQGLMGMVSMVQKIARQLSTVQPLQRGQYLAGGDYL